MQEQVRRSEEEMTGGNERKWLSHGEFVEWLNKCAEVYGLEALTSMEVAVVGPAMLAAVESGVSGEALHEMGMKQALVEVYKNKYPNQTMFGAVPEDWEDEYTLEQLRRLVDDKDPEQGVVVIAEREVEEAIGSLKEKGWVQRGKQEVSGESRQFVVDESGGRWRVVPERQERVRDFVEHEEVSGEYV